MIVSRHLIRLMSTVLIVLAFFLAITVPQEPAIAQEQGTDYEWRGPSTLQTITFIPGSETVAVISGFSLRNLSPTASTFELVITSLPSSWDATLSTSRVRLAGTADSGFSNLLSSISLRLVIPGDAFSGSYTLTATAFKLNDENERIARSDVFVGIQLNSGTPGPTPGLPPGCPEDPDPGNDFDSARLVRVDVEYAHGICETGDEDWFKFAAVGGKVYTIDISDMDAGLDLVLELYDANRRFLTSNDDFFNRDPANPDPGDTKPRIQSWRAPADGIYVVRVRDSLGIGGADLGYRIVVIGESFGPIPTTVPEICNDRYEPNGLPEIAPLLVSNETQREHRFCPAGDADWVQFFGIAGRLYLIYTDTRPYATDPEDPLNYPQPGSDTILFLFDRDGARLLDFNNDIPGGNSLDSEIQFRPVVDGFYYVQVKNVGDIGNQFIRYDLTVRACPGQYCRPDPPSAESAP